MMCDDSLIFLRWHAEVLSADNHKTLVIPEDSAPWFQTLTMRPGDVEATYADIEELKRDVGFESKTLRATGIARWTEWHRAYKSI